MVGITDLPENVVEVILECLPVLDAVRTSVLSKKWRYRWATVSKLHLNSQFFNSCLLVSRRSPSITYGSLIKHIIIERSGHLLDFELYIPGTGLDNSDVDLIVRFALRNGVRKLSLQKYDYVGAVKQGVPTPLYSAAQQLSELKLCNFVLDPHRLHGPFPNLKSLELDSVEFTDFDGFSGFIASCPKLQNINLKNLNNSDQHLSFHAEKLINLKIHGYFKSVSLGGMQELSSLSLILNKLHGNIKPCPDYTVSFFGQLSKIKSLELGIYMLDFFAVDGLPRKLPATLHALENIEVVQVELRCPEKLQFLLCLMRSSPNLRQLHITSSTGNNEYEEPHPEALFGTVTCRDNFLQHLRTVRMYKMTGKKIELMLAEFLLKYSPVLKIMSVQLETQMKKDARMETMKELMRFCRTSSTSQLLCKYN